MRNNPEYPSSHYQQISLPYTPQTYNKEFSLPLGSLNQQLLPIRKNVLMQQFPINSSKDQPQTIVLFKYNPSAPNFRNIDQNNMKITNTSIDKTKISQNVGGKPIYTIQNKEKTQSSQHNSQRQQLFGEPRIQILPPHKKMKQDAFQKGRVKSKTEMLKYEAILEERPEFQQSRHDRPEIIPKIRQPAPVFENTVIKFEQNKLQKEEISTLKKQINQLRNQNLQLKERQAIQHQELSALRRELIEAKSENNRLRTEVILFDSKSTHIQEKQKNKQTELIQEIKALKIQLQKSQNEKMMAQVSEAELQKKLKRVLQDNDKKEGEIIRLKKLTEPIQKTERNIRYYEYSGNNP